MIDSLLAFIGYENMSGWQRVALLAIAAFLIWKTALVVKEIAFYVCRQFSPLLGEKPKEKRKTPGRHTKYASVRLADNLDLETVISSSSDLERFEPPEAVGVSLDCKRAIDRGHINDFLGLLYAYLKGDTRSDKEYGVGASLIAKLCRRIEYDASLINEYRFKYDLCLCFDGKEYLFDDFQVQIIYTSLKENLRKCALVGVCGTISYGNEG
ncbi:MAG: hypothetical protein LBO72_01585 [Helicobacteraceae bacterium]|jgi:hypothetical protein|nr:hypothetical protein [Helicobacteraceae bacterium]